MQLGKKIGPFPVWAWGAVVVGLVGFLYLRSRASASPPVPSTGDQPGQASGAAAPDQGSPPPLGLDPSILDALLGQNSTLTQALLNAFQGAYGGGAYGQASGNPYATATPSGASTASGATGTATPSIVGTSPIFAVSPTIPSAGPAGGGYIPPPSYAPSPAAGQVGTSTSPVVVSAFGSGGSGSGGVQSNVHSGGVQM